MSGLVRSSSFQDATVAILRERHRQETLRLAGKFDQTCASPAMESAAKLSVLLEEVGEVAHAINENDSLALRTELVQVAAVAVAWLESLT